MAKKITAPKTYNPGNGHPKEHLAYLNWREMQALHRLNGGNVSRGPKGLPSFIETSGTKLGSDAKSTTTSKTSSVGGGNKTGVGGGGAGGGGATGTKGSSVGASVGSKSGTNASGNMGGGGKGSTSSTSTTKSTGPSSSLSSPNRTAPSTGTANKDTAAQTKAAVDKAKAAATSRSLAGDVAKSGSKTISVGPTNTKVSVSRPSDSIISGAISRTAAQVNKTVTPTSPGGGGMGSENARRGSSISPVGKVSGAEAPTNIGSSTGWGMNQNLAKMTDKAESAVTQRGLSAAYDAKYNRAGPQSYGPNYGPQRPTAGAGMTYGSPMNTPFGYDQRKITDQVTSTGPMSTANPNIKKAYDPSYGPQLPAKAFYDRVPSSVPTDLKYSQPIGPNLKYSQPIGPGLIGEYERVSQRLNELENAPGYRFDQNMGLAAPAGPGPGVYGGIKLGNLSQPSTPAYMGNTGQYPTVMTSNFADPSLSQDYARAVVGRQGTIPGLNYGDVTNPTAYAGGYDPLGSIRTPAAQNVAGRVPTSQSPFGKYGTPGTTLPAGYEDAYNLAPEKVLAVEDVPPETPVASQGIGELQNYPRPVDQATLDAIAKQEKINKRGVGLMERVPIAGPFVKLGERIYKGVTGDTIASASSRIKEQYLQSSPEQRLAMEQKYPEMRRFAVSIGETPQTQIGGGSGTSFTSNGSPFQEKGGKTERNFGGIDQLPVKTATTAPKATTSTTGSRPAIYYSWDLGVNIPSPGDANYTQYQTYLAERQAAQAAAGWA